MVDKTFPVDQRFTQIVVSEDITNGFDAISPKRFRRRMFHLKMNINQFPYIAKIGRCLISCQSGFGFHLYYNITIATRYVRLKEEGWVKKDKLICQA